MISLIYKSKTKAVFCFSVVLLIFFLVIANPSLYFFLNDDFIHIPLAGKNDFLHGFFYRPLSNFSLWIDNKMWGQNAFGYHLTNIVIHLIDTVLFFFLGKKFFSLSSCKSFHNLKAVFSALLFLIYAYHSESIFWIIGRGGSLATLFFLLALLFYLKSWSGGFSNYIVSLFFFGVGLFVYEVIWIYPLIVMIFIIIFRPSQGQYQKLFVIIILFSLFLLLRIQITKTTLNEYEEGALGQFRLITILYNYNTLLARCFLPPMKDSILFLVLYIGLLIALALILFKFRKNKLLITAFCCLVVSVLPTVSLGIDTHDSESERYIYLASLFAILFIIEFLFQFNRKVILLGFGLLISFHCYKIGEAADSYKFSSMITKKSLECLHPDSTDKIIALNVPSQYEGALIFRIGLPEALQWLKGLNKDNVLVLNQKEVFKKFTTLYCENLGNKNFKGRFLDKIKLESRSTDTNRILVSWNHDSLFIQRE